MTNRFSASIVAALLALSGSAFGWGKDGHETVGLIAARLIAGSHAERAVKALLKPGESLASAAEWADCAKGFNYCNKQPTEEMQQFAQRNPSHHSYHYTDVPFQLSTYDEAAIGASKDDVVHAMEDAIRTLKNQAPASASHDFTKREALFILAHMKVAFINRFTWVPPMWTSTSNSSCLKMKSKPSQSSHRVAISFATVQEACTVSGIAPSLPRP